MNPFRKVPGLLADIGADNTAEMRPAPYLISASSVHSGGANFAFMDGSVRFPKETINTWPYDPNTRQPVGVEREWWTPKQTPGAKVQGPFGSNVSRNGGAVMSNDPYCARCRGSGSRTRERWERLALRSLTTSATSRLLWCCGSRTGESSGRLACRRPMTSATTARKGNQPDPGKRAFDAFTLVEDPRRTW
jgi:prepilin-type processing-associated H-X9-DG protein